MKNYFSKLKSRIKKAKVNSENKGSGLILVIVAVAFIGILVGSLLTAVGYAYRLKLYDYNAKDNFYYLEQAMDEVYAGVGNTTLSLMQEAYTEVVNDMVIYSPETKSYITKDSEELNKQFKKAFLYRVATASFFDTTNTEDTDKETLDNYLRSYITNSDVELIKNRATVEKYVMENGTERKANSGETDFSSIIIKNVTLTRTAKYQRSAANGEFTQTISTDIVISQPDFAMDFNSINTNYSTLFDYCMIADNGIEITQNQGSLNISGNIYAAADFYNKGYNQYTSKTSAIPGAVRIAGYQTVKNEDGGYFNGKTAVTSAGATVTAGEETEVGSEEYPSVYKQGNTASYFTFDNGTVCSKAITALRNTKEYTIKRELKPYDGVNENSRNSGLYIKGDNVKVNIQASELIVPGTIAIMDGAALSLYGKTGLDVDETDVWADNVVLGGKGSKGNHPDVMIRGNLHVRDDLELNADYSTFQLAGRYYGFGNGTKKDSRAYVSTVDKSALYYYTYDEKNNLVLDDNGQPVLNPRGHYNSSSIVVNGEQSKLNLFRTNALFIAGRAYVELSKDYENKERKRVTVSENGLSNDTANEDVETDSRDEAGNVKKEEVLVFDGTTDDFRTGESISLKTNQLAYVPANITGTVTSNVEKVPADGPAEYYLVELRAEVQDALPFKQILGGGKKLEKVPCIKYYTKNGIEYYYDFDSIYKVVYNSTPTTIKSFSYNFQETEAGPSISVDSGDILIDSGKELARQFIIYYYTELANYASTKKQYLKDITATFNGFDFTDGEIMLPESTAKIYSSGAIMAKSGTEFEISAQENIYNALIEKDALTKKDSESEKMLGVTVDDDTVASEENVALVADDFETRYAYIKWALANYTSLTDAAEMDYVSTIRKTYGEQYLTPINRYLNFNKIGAATNIHPKLKGLSSTVGTELDLQSGYGVWISNNDVTVSTDREDGVAQGIVITKGNVFFDNTVSKFEGLIVCGDKIFVDNYSAMQLPNPREDATGDRAIVSISASPEVVRSILYECMSMTEEKYVDLAKFVLSLFKSHESFAYDKTVYKSMEVTYKTIDTIRYSDVVRYNNWMKNVTDVSPIVKSNPSATGGTTGGETTGGGTTGGESSGGGTTGGDSSGGGTSGDSSGN